MKYILTICIILLFCFRLNAQTENKLFTLDPAADNYSRLSDRVDGYTSLKLNETMLNRIISERTPVLNLEIPLSEAASVNLDLAKFEILTPDAKLIEKSASGETELDKSIMGTSYTGKVRGVDGSFVSLSFSINGVTGLVVTPSNEYELGKSSLTGTYVIYEKSKLKIHSDFNCGSDAFGVPARINGLMQNLSTRETNATTNFLQANIAFDVDHATYVDFGSTPAASAYVYGLISTVSALYIREMNIKLVVPYIRVWSTADPYTGATSNDILTQFRSTWNSTQQAVPRTIAHLISTRSGGLGGIAFLDVLCASTSSGFGYGFSNTNGQYNQLPSYSWDVDVVAHELGHNFGSPHTHSCTWPGGPIDTCYAVEGGCYSGPTHPKIGTIMSYCHLSAGKTLDFGTLPRNLIRVTAESAGCITNASETMLIAFPRGGEGFRTYTSINIIWGTSITGTVNIELTTNNGSSWSVIQNNVPANQNQYMWAIPNLDTTFQARIKVSNSSNAAQYDTSSVFSIFSNLTLNGMSLISPPTSTKIYTSPADTGSVNFSWKKAGFHPSIRYKWSVKKVGSSQEFFYTSNQSGADTSASIKKKVLDSLARNVMGFTGDSVWCTWRAWAYNAYDSVSSNIFLLTIADQSTGINQLSGIIPGEYKLYNNYPNPFNPETSIRFDIPSAGNVELKIYDSKGSETSVLLNEKMNPGSYEYKWNAVNFPSGVYFYRLVTGGFSQTKRMILIK